MRHLYPAKTGFAVGSVLALWHLGWVCLVAAGWAKPVMDFVLRLHFIDLRYELTPFVLGTAAMLVLVTFALGFAFGAVFAIIWNWLAGSSGRSESRHPSPASA